MRTENSDEAYQEDGLFFKPGFGITEWEALQQQLPIGSIITGKVVHQAHFGVFMDAGLGFPVLMEITNFDSPEPPSLGCTISGQVADFTDHNWQVRVIKLSDY